MELQVGMYIRTHNGISKIIKFGGDKTQQEKKDTIITDVTFTFSSLVKKASFSLIDLIEAGDYVNGIEVAFVEDNQVAVCLNDLTTKDYEGRCEFLRYFESDIKSIATKEQMKSIEYKVSD